MLSGFNFGENMYIQVFYVGANREINKIYQQFIYIQPFQQKMIQNNLEV